MSHARPGSSGSSSTRSPSGSEASTGVGARSKGPKRSRVILGSVVVLLVWLVVGALSGPLAGKLSEVQKNDSMSFLPESAEATEVVQMQKAFAEINALPAIVVYDKPSGVLEPKDFAVLAKQAEMLGADPVLAPFLASAVSPPVPSQDGEVAQIFVPFDADKLAAPAEVPPIQTVTDRLRELVGNVPGYSTYVTGASSQLADLFEVFGDLDGRLLVTTALVVAFILILVYRSPFLWLIPLVTAGFALTSAQALVYLLAKEGILTLDGQGQGILLVLVFGAATDYALLLIARYREELLTQESGFVAMRIAMRSAGEAIVASAFTVIAGLLCLLFSDVSSNKSMGPVAATGIFCALLASLSVLPAILLLVGRRVFWPFVPRVGDSASAEVSGLWSRVASFVGRKPRAIWMGTTALLLGLVALLPMLNASGISQSEAFTSKPESVRGQEVLALHFPAGLGSPTIIIGNADAYDAMKEAASKVQGVDRVDAYTGASTSLPAAPGAAVKPPLVKDGKVQLEATLAVAADSKAAQKIVVDLREALRAVPGADAKVGGSTAIAYDVQTASQADRNRIIPIALAVIFLILAVLLRALLAPALLIATVVLSFLATLGACGFFFSKVFGFAGEDSSFPLFAFVFLVALGVDYNIFLMTRVREESVKVGTRQGTLVALAVTGGVITSAGVVLAATFGALAVLPLVFIVEIGFAVAFGVLLDTLIVRSLLVPALTYDIGKAVWWPSALWRADEAPKEPVSAGSPTS